MVCHYPMRGILIIYFVGINLVTFLLYGVDKWKARKGRWRIPEDSLIWLAVAGGSIGALIAMWLFRHKTRHLKFILGIPAILLLQALLVFWLFRR